MAAKNSSRTGLSVRASKLRHSCIGSSKYANASIG